ncbi:MAG: gamma carbonic anhydrase family protein [Aquificaceae bacterium]|nr:gamma carbonic anhydrase family protein [Aquificaceae bacterium]MDW8237225.1 gamma carbonic anhydrase family protein [Aquificaceae bacterium]
MLMAFNGKFPKIAKGVYISPGCYIIGDVEIGKDSSVWFGTVIRGDVNYIKIGERVNIQDNCVIHVTHKTHPTILYDDITVGHRVILHGCTIKSQVLIGMGAIIMDGAIVSENSIVGAGALITQNKSFPPGVLIAGFPAKVIRDLTQSEIEAIKTSVENYVSYKNLYLSQDQSASFQ